MNKKYIELTIIIKKRVSINFFFNIKYYYYKHNKKNNNNL